MLRSVRRSVTSIARAAGVAAAGGAGAGGLRRVALLRRGLSSAAPGGSGGGSGASGNAKWIGALAIGSAAAAGLYLQQSSSTTAADAKVGRTGAGAVSRFTTAEAEQARVAFVDAYAPARAGAGAGVAPADDPSQSTLRRFADVITRAQNQICSQVEGLEISAGSSARFVEERDVGVAAPGGRQVFRSTRVMQDGKVFDKTGCSITTTHSPYPASVAWLKGKLADVPALAPVIAQVEAYQNAMKADAKQTAVPAPKLPFHTAALSLVFHPSNPHAPTVHMNVRYFEVEVPNGESVWWFGGGSDLTPKYLYEDDAVHFHQTLAAAADRFDARYYPAYKQWADAYFNLPHRGNERRGVGGIFFDNFGATHAGSTAAAIASASLAHGKSASQAVEFVAATANAMAPAYFPIVTRRKDTPFTAEHVQWQRLRHGRYVEFNLMHDEGTKYGLANSAAATEAILMSLPRDVSYRYKFVPKPDSPEAKLQAVLLKPRDWLQPAPAVTAPVPAGPAAAPASSTAAVSR